MVGGYLLVLRLPPPLKLVSMIIDEILSKVAIKHQKSNQISQINQGNPEFSELENDTLDQTELN